MDDITVRTPCELLYQQRKKIKVVAHGIAEVPIQGGTIHGAPIPEGYARVLVDRVEKGWEDLDLEIPGGDGEEKLQHALHTWICWNKRYIRFPQGTTYSAASAQNARSRSPTPPKSMGPLSSPAQRSPSMDLPSPSLQRDPSMDLPSPATNRDPGMSPPPPKVKINANAWVPSPPPPKVKKNPAMKKEKPPPPKLAYNMTNEELNAHVRKEVTDYFTLKRMPEPKQPVNPAGKKFFIGICQPREKETLSDYDCSITNSYQKKSNCRYKNIP
ncbi:hypothetical protein C2845_PM14G08240 [Panicum miliaceum]|uniref:DUF8039 domain-containing protein n=1 Tax=Panicum miliaceum TaxID=4540 RepID=A0A3L6PP53_PANMI|nr:hypothetical protein C2845_PM14G08240 [Panicum miliaceum]